MKKDDIIEEIMRLIVQCIENLSYETPHKYDTWQKIKEIRSLLRLL